MTIQHPKFIPSSNQKMKILHPSIASTHPSIASTHPSIHPSIHHSFMKISSKQMIQIFFKKHSHDSGVTVVSIIWLKKCPANSLDIKKNTIGRDSPNCTLIPLDFSCSFLFLRVNLGDYGGHPPIVVFKGVIYLAIYWGRPVQVGVWHTKDQQVTSPQKCIPMCFQWVILTIDPKFWLQQATSCWRKEKIFWKFCWFDTGQKGYRVYKVYLEVGRWMKMGLELLHQSKKLSKVVLLHN